MEYIEIGPVPASEPCAQVGTDNYLARSMRECEVFRRMLERVLPIPEGLPVKYVVRAIRPAADAVAAIGLPGAVSSSSVMRPRRASTVGCRGTGASCGLGGGTRPRPDQSFVVRAMRAAVASGKLGCCLSASSNCSRAFILLPAFAYTAPR